MDKDGVRASFLASLIERDGSIWFRDTKRKFWSYSSYDTLRATPNYFQVSFTTGNRIVAEWAEKYFGFSTNMFKFETLTGYAHRWRSTATFDQAEKVLNAVLPHLRLTKTHAERCLADYIEYKKHRAEEKVAAQVCGANELR